MSLDRLQKIELIARIASLVAVPVLIALFGWLIQAELSDKSLRKEYVQVAIGILGAQDKSKENQALKEWATDLLAANAPTRLSESALKELRTGTPLYPRMVNVPVAIPCIPSDLDIKKPRFPYDGIKDSDSDYKKTLALYADRLVRMNYIAELEAIVEGCRKLPPVERAK